MRQSTLQTFDRWAFTLGGLSGLVLGATAMAAVDVGVAGRSLTWTGHADGLVRIFFVLGALGLAAGLTIAVALGLFSLLEQRGAD